MTRSRLIGLALPMATAGVYAWLVLGHGLALQDMAGGLQPFDLRVRGYSLVEAQDYLAALPAEGSARYLGPVRVLDTLFPVLMALTLMWWMRPHRGAMGLVCMAVAAGYAVLDLAENAAVATLLRAGVDGADATAVALASALTQAKFVAFAVAALLAAWRLAQRSKRVAANG